MRPETLSTVACESRRLAVEGRDVNTPPVVWAFTCASKTLSQHDLGGQLNFIEISRPDHGRLNAVCLRSLAREQCHEYEVESWERG